MKLPRRRSSRQWGRAPRTTLTLVGDYPDTDRNITEAMMAIPPAPWHGTTIPLAALRGQPHYAPAPVTAPPRTHQAAYGEWTGTMTVNDTPASAADHMDARCRAARTFIDLKHAYLEQKGMGYRIDDADQVLQRGEELPPGSVIAETHREAVTHLVGDWGEWAPAGGWNHGWARGLPWYRPEDGDDGLPLHPPGAAS
jgi:hypothetical protein